MAVQELVGQVKRQEIVRVFGRYVAEGQANVQGWGRTVSVSDGGPRGLKSRRWNPSVRRGS